MTMIYWVTWEGQFQRLSGQSLCAKVSRSLRLNKKKRKKRQQLQILGTRL